MCPLSAVPRHKEATSFCSFYSSQRHKTQTKPQQNSLNQAGKFQSFHWHLLGLWKLETGGKKCKIFQSTYSICRPMRRRIPRRPRPLSCSLRNNCSQQHGSVFPSSKPHIIFLCPQTRGAPADPDTAPVLTSSNDGASATFCISDPPAYPTHKLTSQICSGPFCHHNREGRDTN